MQEGLVAKKLKCPVCGKPLTQIEFDRALGLWKDKQEHIHDLEKEKKELRRQGLELSRTSARREQEFRKREAELEKKTKRLMAQEKKKAARELREQRATWEKKLHERVKSEVKQGVK